MVAADTLIAVCESAKLADGGKGFRFAVQCAARETGAFVVRFRGQAYGYLNHCPHASSELDWLAGQFFDREGQVLLCATHGAEFDPASGACQGGPCVGRGGLRRLQVIEVQGVVYWRPDEEARPLAARRFAR